MRSWLISPPNQFSPRYKWEAFLKKMETHPGKDDPHMKREIAEVQRYLEEADRKAAGSAKTETR